MAEMLTGFGNHFSTEAVGGALPIGRNSPQRAPFGLYAEQLSGTAFTAPRAENRRSWLYRRRPSVMHPAFRPYAGDTLIRGAPFAAPTPNRLRWDPLPLPDAAVDFVDGLVTWAGNDGVAVHLYAASAPMVDRAFASADGELLIVPQQGRLHLVTELGRFTVSPLQIAVIPRGCKFRVELPDGAARGYVAENHGPALRLPELGPIGANGLANQRDFEAPVAAFEDSDAPCEIVHKLAGRLWTTTLDHSPFDVVAWHGNLAPVRYDLTRFNTLGTISFDHPDPSIFTVLTSPGELDFAIFPPRWLVAEDTFRPPWFHRNVMSEFMGLIHGTYDAKAGGFAPGGASLHPCMSAHGPDRESCERAIAAELAPHRIGDTMAFMFETRLPLAPTRHAMETPLLQADYDACWQGVAKAQLP